MSITAENRAAVQSAYGYCCGYCGVSEIDIGGELQIDHYRPRTKGGSDDVDNLVYACSHCNRFKGNYWPDANSPDSFYLLHPGEDDVWAHLQFTTSGRLAGLTPRGWFHIHWLHLNRPQLVLWRQNQQRVRELKEALAQSKAITDRLQERIRELEREAAELRARMARLTGGE